MNSNQVVLNVFSAHGLINIEYYKLVKIFVHLQIMDNESFVRNITLS